MLGSVRIRRGVKRGLNGERPYPLPPSSPLPSPRCTEGELRPWDSPKDVRVEIGTKSCHTPPSWAGHISESSL